MEKPDYCLSVSDSSTVTDDKSQSVVIICDADDKVGLWIDEELFEWEEKSTFDQAIKKDYQYLRNWK